MLLLYGKEQLALFAFSKHLFIYKLVFKFVYVNFTLTTIFFNVSIAGLIMKFHLKMKSYERHKGAFLFSKFTFD